MRRPKGSKNVRLVGAVLAVGLSLVPLMVGMELANGMIEGITQRFIELGTYHLQLHIYDDLPDSRIAEMIHEIRQGSGVRLAVQERQGLGILHSSKERVGVQIRSVPVNLHEWDEGLRRYLEFSQGRFDLRSSDSILLGGVIAEKLGVGVGDEVKLLTVKRLRSGKFIPRVSRFRIRGIFSTGYQDLDKLWVYVPLPVGLRILPLESARQFIGIKVKDPFGGLEGYVRSIRETLPEDIALFRIDTWFEVEQNQYQSYRTTKALLVFIMFLIVLVACVNVSSTLVMMVIERTHEIGILKSLGASPSLIELSYILTGFFTGIVGSALGIAVGLGLSVNINEIIRATERLLTGLRSVVAWMASPFLILRFERPVTLLDPAFYLETIPIRIELFETVAVAALTTLLATLAAYLPARRAGAVRPLEVLRRV
jgi:lipoprotein-releasing system permease protein